MTKEKAIEAMLRGEKITHPYFGKDEYITMKGNKIISEDGYTHPEFWQLRATPEWQTDFEIYKPIQINQPK